MKVKISEKQYAMIEKMARTKVALNHQWWSVGTINVVDTDSVCKRYDDCVSTNLSGLLREAMVAKYLDNVGVAYKWWIPFASGNLVDRVSEFHVGKHRIDVKPVIVLKYVENGAKINDGRVDVETLTQGLALDATQSYFRNNVDDIYIGVYLNDSLNGDIRGYQWRDSTKWRRYLREYSVSNEIRFNDAMCCPVDDLISMNSFRDLDNVIYNKSSTSHRFIDVHGDPAIPNSYTLLDKTEEYDMTFIESWCKEWKLGWNNGIFTRDSFGPNNYNKNNDSNIGKVANKNITKVGSSKVDIRKKADKENRRKKLNEEYYNIKIQLKEEDRKRKLNNEYENTKRKLKERSVKICDVEKMEYGNMEKAKNVDVLGITNDIVTRSKKWKELTDNIITLSDKKDENIRRKEALESELINIDNEIVELSDKIESYKKESEDIEDSFRLIDQIDRNVEEKN
jgi:hypothetical protein